ncbi:MAG: redoxin domain-containing protein [Bacteroidetes bacterium]|nr:redoxin domain-containing protein [Bacteroidota bacterium]MCH8524590.1 redoxin domain-containing protein [Balneolales bacterium]
MINKGEKMSTDFELDIVQNGEEKRVKFADILTRPTIVSVYMKNNTGSCDKQNISLAADQQAFENKGVNLITLSKDTCGSHKKYAEKHGISYILASDPELLFSKATDSIVEKKMYGKTYDGPARAAFYINTDGEILGLIEKVDPKNHAQELLELIG